MSFWDSTVDFLEGSWETVTTGAGDFVDNWANSWSQNQSGTQTTTTTTNQNTQNSQNTQGNSNGQNANPSTGSVVQTGLPFNMTMQELALSGGVLTLVTILLLRK